MAAIPALELAFLSNKTEIKNNQLHGIQALPSYILKIFFFFFFNKLKTLLFKPWDPIICKFVSTDDCS